MKFHTMLCVRPLSTPTVTCGGGYEIATVGIAIYDDCIVIEKCRTLSGQDFSKRTDAARGGRPQNDINASESGNRQRNVYIGGLIEHWGRGLSMMARECERVGLPVRHSIRTVLLSKLLLYVLMIRARIQQE